MNKVDFRDYFIQRPGLSTNFLTFKAEEESRNLQGVGKEAGIAGHFKPAGIKPTKLEKPTRTENPEQAAEKAKKVKIVSYKEKRRSFNSRLHEAISDYKITALIGRGAYGKVFEARHLPTGRIVAIKYIKNIYGSFLRARTVLREVTILRSFAQMGEVPLVNHLLDMKIVDVDGGENASIFLVLDYEPRNLREVLEKSDQEKIIHRDCKKLFYTFLCGIKFIHSAGLMHRDIKPTNLLVTSDGGIKFCDFGLSRRASEKYESLKLEPSYKKISQELLTVKAARERRPEPRELSNHISTRWYRAPEIIVLQESYDQAVDLWAAGCIMSEVLCCVDVYQELGVRKDSRVVFPGRSCYPLSPTPNNEVDDDDQLFIILSVLGKLNKYDKSFLSTKRELDYVNDLMSDTSRIDFRNEFPETSQELVGILGTMLEFNPFFRSTAAELLKCPYFDSVRSKKLEEPAPFKIELPFDQAGIFDYKVGEPTGQVSIKDIRAELYREEVLVKEMALVSKQ